MLLNQYSVYQSFTHDKLQNAFQERLKCIPLHDALHKEFI